MLIFNYFWAMFSFLSVHQMKVELIFTSFETLGRGLYLFHMVSMWNDFCLIKLKYVFNFEISSQVRLEINPRF